MMRPTADFSPSVWGNNFISCLSNPKVQKLAQAYLVEVRWRDNGYIPTFTEYMKNGIASSTCPAFAAASILGLGHIATRDMFDWISNYDIPKIVRASAIIGRLTDDRASHKFEMDREHVTTAVECCMNEHKISEEQALQLLNKDIEKGWKAINEEFLNPNGIPMPVLEFFLNFSRMCEFVYANSEYKYTHGELMKDYVVALLVDPIKIEQEE